MTRCLQPVPLSEADAERFRPLLGAGSWRRFMDAGRRASSLLSGRTVWHLNSTTRGGGVAELLAALLPIARGGGVDARWLALEASPDFFELTKELHNLLHAGPDVPARRLEKERGRYESGLAPAGAELEGMVKRGDVVVVHDPQPAGLIPAAKRLGARVVWRCHIGTDSPGPAARQVWEFLLPYVSEAEATVFSRAGYRWTGLDAGRSFVIAPSIDPFSPKNQELTAAGVRAILVAIGLVAGGMDSDLAGRTSFVRGDGSAGTVRRAADILQDERLPLEAPVVLQVSRWDRLKDPVGVLRGFALGDLEEVGAHLVLAGPASVSDDPEGEAVLDEVRQSWEGLPASVRRRTHIVSLPLADVDENAAAVNALQRQAAVVVQKSLEEGFGLTVAEAMWKGRAVLASRRGGIQDQIVDGQSGWLLDDPTDLESFGSRLRGLLQSPDEIGRVGAAAHAHAQRDFLAPRHLEQWAELLERLLRA